MKKWRGYTWKLEIVKIVESYLIIWVEYLFVLPVTKSWKKSFEHGDP